MRTSYLATLATLEIDEVLWTGYRLAAGALAEQVSLDPASCWAPRPGSKRASSSTRSAS